MKDKIIVDTNFLCALENPNDSLHDKAIIAKRLTKGFKLIITNFILLETYTILSQRVSKGFAVSFGERLQEKHPFTLFWIDKRLEEEVWKIFVSIKDKNFSYVDASILAVMNKEKITHLLSFDESFTKLQKQFRFELITN